MKFYYEGNEEATWGTEKFSMKVKDILNWLEKQGEQKVSEYDVVKTIEERIIEHFDNHLIIDKCFSIGGLKDDILKIINEVKFAKQDEQKPFDYENANIQQKDFAPKVEPKFKVGDWIVHDMSDGRKAIRQIINMTNKSYVLDGEDFNIFYFNDLENDYHLWTIQDAKNGDVLYSIDSKQPFIYKERPQFSQAIGYCCINRAGEFAIWNTSKCIICTDKYIPATKEQRDLLFSKMKEAGYKWDAEKKELKKIEHNVQLTEFEDAIKDMMNDYSDAIDGNDATI